MRSAKMGRFASDAEERNLQFGLRLDARPERVKAALQWISDFHDIPGNRIRDPHAIRQLIHSHLTGPNVDLRRWSMKALGLMRNVDDFERIANQTRHEEEDRQAQAWGLAAMLSISKEHSVKEIRHKTGLEADKSLDLAAMLYAEAGVSSTFSDRRILRLGSTRTPRL